MRREDDALLPAGFRKLAEQRNVLGPAMLAADGEQHD
jgi:hypothetical protein